MAQVGVAGKRCIFDANQRATIRVLSVEAADAFGAFCGDNARAAVVALHRLAVGLGDVRDVARGQREDVVGGCGWLEC